MLLKKCEHFNNITNIIAQVATYSIRITVFRNKFYPPAAMGVPLVAIGRRCDLRLALVCARSAWVTAG